MLVVENAGKKFQTPRFYNCSKIEKFYIKLHSIGNIFQANYCPTK